MMCYVMNMLEHSDMLAARELRDPLLAEQGCLGSLNPIEDIVLDTALNRTHRFAK